ncbi:MAG TPA: hypothetical protein VIV60_25875 [Polyangiaceae bacterium]
MNEQLATVREVLTFYADGYSEVRFPEVDVDILSTALSEVEAAAGEVTAALEVVARRKAELEGLERELMRKVSRAIAFLKVHVDSDEASYARLDALNQSLLSNVVAQRAGHTRRTRTRLPGESLPAVDHAMHAAISVGDDSAAIMANG